MITLAARWTDWHLGDKIVHPTPGRDRPIIVACSSESLAAEMRVVFQHLGCTVETLEARDG